MEGSGGGPFQRRRLNYGRLPAASSSGLRDWEGRGARTGSPERWRQSKRAFIDSLGLTSTL